MDYFKEFFKMTIKAINELKNGRAERQTSLDRLQISLNIFRKSGVGVSIRNIDAMPYVAVSLSEGILIWRSGTFHHLDFLENPRKLMSKDSQL